MQPGLGVSWSHVPRTRILLEQVEQAATPSSSSLRSATLIKSSRQVQTSGLSGYRFSIPSVVLPLQPCNIRVEFDLEWWSRSRPGPTGTRQLEETDLD